MVVEVTLLVNEGADSDVKLGLAIVAEVAESSGVEATGDGLKLSDNFARSYFRSSGDRTTGEAGTEGAEGVFLGGEGAANGGDEVVDVLKFFELENIADVNGAEAADLAEVIT